MFDEVAPPNVEATRTSLIRLDEKKATATAEYQSILEQIAGVDPLLAAAKADGDVDATNTYQRRRDVYAENIAAVYAELEAIERDVEAANAVLKAAA